MSSSKKGKKQDVSSSDDGFESYVRDCLQAIRQDIEEIKKNQGKFKEDLQAVKKKLDRTEKSLKDKFEALEGEVHEAMVKFSTTRGASTQQQLIPFSRINIRKFCPTVIGKYYWNALPVCIRDLTTKTAFKKALRKYYLA